jgi:hypothetical protein
VNPRDLLHGTRMFASRTLTEPDGLVISCGFTEKGCVEILIRTRLTASHFWLVASRGTWWNASLPVRLRRCVAGGVRKEQTNLLQNNCARPTTSAGPPVS